MQAKGKMRRRLRGGPGKSAGSRQIHQPVSNRVHHEFGSFVNSKTIHDVGAMHGDGIHTELEFRGNFLVGFAGDDVLQNFEFARGERSVALAFECFGALELWIDDRFACGNILDGAGQVEIVGVF